MISLDVSLMADCQGELVVETSLVGNVLNGLSHFHRVRDRAQFAMCLIRGLGGNLTEASREEFAKQVLFPLSFAAISYDL